MKRAPLSSIKEITISDYDYTLPPERIAWYPPQKRGASKLLVSAPDGLTQAPFSCIGEHLPPGAMLVFNETKVVQARMRGGNCNQGCKRSAARRILGGYFSLE